MIEINIISSLATRFSHTPWLEGKDSLTHYMILTYNMLERKRFPHSLHDSNLQHAWKEKIPSLTTWFSLTTCLKGKDSLTHYLIFSYNMLERKRLPHSLHDSLLWHAWKEKIPSLTTWFSYNMLERKRFCHSLHDSFASCSIWFPYIMLERERHPSLTTEEYDEMWACLPWWSPKCCPLKIINMPCAFIYIQLNLVKLGQVYMRCPKTILSDFVESGRKSGTLCPL